MSGITLQKPCKSMLFTSAKMRATWKTISCFTQVYRHKGLRVEKHQHHKTSYKCWNRSRGCRPGTRRHVASNIVSLMLAEQRTLGKNRNWGNLGGERKVHITKEWWREAQVRWAKSAVIWSLKGRKMWYLCLT